MKPFAEFLIEEKGGKNLHLEHIEDEIINYGITGARAAINFLRSLRNMLSGSSTTKVNMTVKWDGAPAIFAGIDPSDGKFFVAKKGLFNKEPKLYKSHAEIDADLSGNLNEKFKTAFTYLSKLGIKGVLQGDLMFTNDIESKEIDGETYLTFQPNTLVYAVQKNSNLGKTISSAKMGIVWHTTYTGNDLQSMSASFGVDISGLKKTRDVWMDDATYKDVSGTAKFTKKETDELTKILSAAGVALQGIDSAELKKLLENQSTVMTGSLVGGSFKTYINSFIKSGTGVSLSAAKKTPYAMFVKKYFDEKVLPKVKSEKGKIEKEKLRDNLVKEYLKFQSTIEKVISFMESISEGKIYIIKKLNSIESMTKIFIRTDNGYKVTNPEGYVAIDTDGKTAVKLVDRMEFSYNNFTAAKNWTK